MTQRIERTSGDRTASQIEQYRQQLEALRAEEAELAAQAAQAQQAAAEAEQAQANQAAPPSAGQQTGNANAPPAAQAEQGMSNAALQARLQPNPIFDDVRAGGGTLLRRGSSGPQVLELQRLLNRLGASPQLDENGTFGPEMVAAVRRFQEQNGCMVDGIVGPETMGALDRAQGFTPHAAAAEATERYRQRGSGGPNAPAPGPSTGPPGTEPPSGPPGTRPPTRPTGPGPTAPPGQPASGGLTGVDRIIDRTAQFESSGRYDAWNADDNGHGVSFGLIQFNQEVGGLPSLMRGMHDRNPQRFNEIFGPHAQNMLSTSWVRSANLNDPDIKRRMQQAGRDPEFQQVQRDLARRDYYDPADRMASENGLRSERARAVLFDSCVQNGAGGTRRFLRQAMEGGGSERDILERFARLADRGRTNGRRQRILNDPAFSDGPVSAGGPPSAGPSGTGNGGTGRAAARPRPGAVSGVDGPTGPSAAGPGGRIGPGARVLMIGDSHTVGTFGTEMDRHLRATGATVETYGNEGSSARNWVRGTRTNLNSVARHADGTVDRTRGGNTPNLRELIQRHRPEVLVVNLGGNMRASSPEEVRRQVRELGEIARENGVRLIWAGPPDRQADMENPAEIDRFNALMREAVGPYGSYVESSRYTEYAGGDGIHYSGQRGTANARRWADGVFREIQGGG